MGFGNTRDLFYEVWDKHVRTVDDHLIFCNDTSDNPPSQPKLKFKLCKTIKRQKLNNVFKLSAITLCIVLFGGLSGITHFTFKHVSFFTLHSFDNVVFKQSWL